MTRHATAAEHADHNRDHRKADPRPSDALTSQQRADLLLAEHQANRRTSSIFAEKQDAALELAGSMQALITTNEVPFFMREYLQARIDRVRRVYGMPPFVAPPPEQITAEQFDDINRRSV